MEDKNIVETISNTANRTEESPLVNRETYKVYLLPNDQQIVLTKDEFDRVVSTFRLLLRQSEQSTTLTESRIESAGNF